MRYAPLLLVPHLGAEIRCAASIPAPEERSGGNEFSDPDCLGDSYMQGRIRWSSPFRSDRIHNGLLPLAASSTNDIEREASENT